MLPPSLRPVDLLTSKPLSPSYPSPLNPLIFISLSSQPPFSILSIFSQPPSISRPSPFNPSLLPIHLLSTPLSSPSHPSPLNPPQFPVLLISTPLSFPSISSLNPPLLHTHLLSTPLSFNPYPLNSFLWEDPVSILMSHVPRATLYLFTYPSSGIRHHLTILLLCHVSWNTLESKRSTLISTLTINCEYTRRKLEIVFDKCLFSISSSSLIPPSILESFPHKLKYSECVSKYFDIFPQ